jgi:hypothetical protein
MGAGWNYYTRDAVNGAPERAAADGCVGAGGGGMGGQQLWRRPRQRAAPRRPGRPRPLRPQQATATSSADRGLTFLVRPLLGRPPPWPAASRDSQANGARDDKDE